MTHKTGTTSLITPERQDHFLSHTNITPARRFAKNAIMLITVNLIMRAVGVSFNVYLSNRAGGEVMGLYSLLFGVYGFALTLGCAGINLGTTRLIADTIGEFDGGNDPFSLSHGCRATVRKALGKCIIYSLAFSIVTGFLLFIFSSHIGTFWLGDKRTVVSLRILSVTLPPIALGSCFSGYFTAVRRVGRNAAVNILGQLVRLGLCAYFLTLWLPRGVEYTCIALVLGGALSEFIGFSFTFFAYIYDKGKYLRSSQSVTSETKGLTKKLLSITLPVTLSACLRSGLITIEHILIPKGLKKSGASWESALTSYGILHSMVLPVVLFPSAFISSFSGLLVPEIAESHARGDLKRVSRISTKIITPALIFSFGVAGIMSCFSHDLGLAIYGSAEAGRYIRMLAPLIPIMYVDSSVDAVLKGMGEQVYSMNVNITDALVSVILVWLLLPRFGLMGYVITIYFTETLNTTLSLTRMLTVSNMKVKLWRQVFGPLVCVCGACCIMRIFLPLFSRVIIINNAVAELVVNISLTAILYFLLLGATKVIGKDTADMIRSVLPSKRTSVEP